MPLSPRIEHRQSQSLVMTPLLMQAIKILQLSNLDLVAYVEAELERNPLLEAQEITDSPAEHPPDDGGTGEKPTAEIGEQDRDWPAEVTEPNLEAIAGKLDTDLANVFQDDPGPTAEESIPDLPPETWSVAPSRQAVSTEDYDLEAFVAEQKSLADHLTDQLGLSITDPDMRFIGKALIDEIDESGYLRADLGGLAERLGTSLDRVEETLCQIQGFEPAGIGARDLAECLTIQLAERDRLDPAMATLVAHLDILARRDHEALKKLCGVDDDDLIEMITEIQALNPKPGNAFGHTMVQPIIPDVLVRPGPDGAWLVELNTDTLPRVLVNRTYHASVAKRQPGDAEKIYLADCLQNANWLVKSLDQRARTILKVASEIVRQQDAFLAHGIQHLRPLNLKTIADAIEMHESTVSRVTSNKYMATTRGIFELKYFFTTAIASSAGGDAYSAEAVRHRIRQVIDEEQPNNILSDDTIVKIMRESGIDLARRTVAKYRETMHIPSSVQRRREKRAAL
jgi:RNA polymerase sigma-54 factor